MKKRSPHLIGGWRKALEKKRVLVRVAESPGRNGRSRARRQERNDSRRREKNANEAGHRV